ncbi:MAG: TIGR03545 family protein [bacterium]
MRPKGIVALFIILVLAALVAYLFSDELIEDVMEDAGSAVVGAKFEIDNLNFSLAGLSISLDRLQVTNPNDTWKNLFETGKMSFDMELAPLARKKIIINEITVADIRVGTQRESDGKIEKEFESDEPGWVDDAKASLMKKVAASPVLNLGILKKRINVDSLMANFDLTAMRNLQSLKLKADSTVQIWNQNIGSFDPKNDLKKIATEIDELKSQEIKGVENLISSIEKTKRLYKALNTFKKDLEQKKNQAISDFQLLTSTFKQVDNWVRDDYNALRNKANLGDFSAQNIGTMLFGENIVQLILNYLPYIDLIRKYMPTAKQIASTGKVEKPPRFKGQDIRFPLRHPRPDFLIEKIFISGASNHADTSQVIFASGEVSGITSHPAIYGKPLSLQLQAQLPESRWYKLTGAVDHTGNIPAERFELRATGVKLGEIALPPKPYLPSRLNAKTSEVKTHFNLVGSNLDFGIQLSARPVKFFFADSLQKNDVISNVTNQVFDSIELLQLSATIQGPANDLALTIQSNIDNVLASRIKSVIGRSVEMARNEIQKKLNTTVEPEKQKIFAFVNENQNKINNEIKKYENSINSKLTEINEKKKALEKKLKQEKEKGLKKATKKIKDIFKKN